MHALELNQLSVALESTPIVKGVSIQLASGAIGCLLGPSGCGKTTLLRAIAGFEPVTAGEVWIDGECVSRSTMALPVEKRRVGMVFQDYALFPHLRVDENIGFGLTAGKHTTDRKSRQERIAQLAEMLDITNLLSSYPHQLSGGQQQRVAIARAIAPRPRILLLDEPFASLDVELREQIARQIRYVLKEDGITTILVSHNQHEAFAMADEIGVMRAGELQQWSTAFELYHNPANTYVADFVGEGVFLSGTVHGECTVTTEFGVLEAKNSHELATGEPVTVLIRPDDIIHDDAGPLSARVVEKAFRGAEYLYTLELDSGAHIISLVPSHHSHEVDSRINFRVEMKHLVIFPQS